MLVAKPTIGAAVQKGYRRCSAVDADENESEGSRSTEKKTLVDHGCIEFLQPDTTIRSTKEAGIRVDVVDTAPLSGTAATDPADGTAATTAQAAPVDSFPVVGLGGRDGGCGFGCGASGRLVMAVLMLGTWLLSYCDRTSISMVVCDTQ